LNDCAMVTVPCLVTVAAGVLAPGHLGELTRYLPFELVDDVLENTRTVQRRMRALPSRVGIYFVLAMTLFPGIGYLRVWDKMTAALEDPGLPRPSEKALRDLRRRLGPAPVRALFETVAVPLASPRVPGVACRGLRTVAFDGLNSVKVPDSDRNRSWPGKTMTQLGIAGYPALRIVALAETGTRGLLGAVIGGKGERSEVPLARKLVPRLREGMLLLADRACDAADLLKEVTAAGAHFLVRGSAARKPAVDEVLPDGSCLSRLDGLRVRIIEAGPDVHGADGTRLGDSCRLITTLLDWRRYPAGELVRLYHERREIEVACLALRHTLPGGYVLRSRDRAGAEQELWALLTIYQALPMAMTAATGSVPGTDPDRASFRRARIRAGAGHHRARHRGPRHPRRCRPDRPRHPRRPAASPAGALQRPESEMLNLPVPPPRPGTARTADADHPGAGHHHRPAPGSARRPSPRPQRAAARSPPAPARHKARQGHPHHGRPARTRLGRTRPRSPARHQAPQHAHPARRMDPPGLPRQDGARQVRTPRTIRAGHSPGRPVTQTRSLPVDARRLHLTTQHWSPQAMRSSLEAGGTAPYPGAARPGNTAAAKPPPFLSWQGNVQAHPLTTRTKRNRSGRVPRCDDAVRTGNRSG
jgi:hypothetical protein